MSNMSNERIEINPNILMGKPVIRGTRIPVHVILNLLAEGYTVDKVIEEYPDITPEDVQATLKYASGVTHFEEFEHAAAGLV